MPSYYFRIEVYGIGNYGCPDYDLMGYNTMGGLLSDCWSRYYEEVKKKDALVANSVGGEDGK